MNHNTLKTAVLLGGLGGVVVLIGSFFGAAGTVIGFLPGPRLRWRLLLVLGPPGHQSRPGLSRSREFQADRSGARLAGDGEPLARALIKLDQAAQMVPMQVQPAQASKYIVNPLTGRKIKFASLFQTHPSTEQRIFCLRQPTTSIPR